MSESLSLALHPAMQDAGQRQVIHKMLSEMLITLSDKVFIDRTFALDGYRFINCRFERCTLTTNRGTFELHHCWFDDATQRVLGSDAQKCVQFYAFKNDKLKASPGFGPTVYPDGTISIALGVSLT
jgi:hypothetical protein